jgi:hypothetical protein
VEIPVPDNARPPTLASELADLQDAEICIDSADLKQQVGVLLIRLNRYQIVSESPNADRGKQGEGKIREFGFKLPVLARSQPG